MDFEFSEEQEMLRASVRAFLADRAPLTAVRADYDAPVFDPAVWRGLVDLGVTELDSMVDAAVVLEELGRAVCPAPYASSVIGARALLPSLSELATLAVYERGARYAWQQPFARVSSDGRLSGTKVHVPDASVAAVFLVTALDTDDEFGVFATEQGV